MLVPSARVKASLDPWVKSTVMVFPRAGSVGQLEFVVGLQLVKVCACASCTAVRATEATEMMVDRILDGVVKDVCC